MNPEFITNDIQLHERIMKLSYRKEEQEIAIKRNVRELGYSLHPAMMLKQFVGKLTEDPETNESVKSLGINLGKDFLLSKLFGKGQTLKGFLTSFVIRKVTDYIVNKNPELISKGLSKLEGFIRDHKKTVEHEDE